MNPSFINFNLCPGCFVIVLYLHLFISLVPLINPFRSLISEEQALTVDHRNVSHWGLSAFHQEFLRRIWANIYILDAYQSVVYGRPPIIQDAECDVVFPFVPLFPLSPFPSSDIFSYFSQTQPKLPPPNRHTTITSVLF